MTTARRVANPDAVPQWGLMPGGGVRLGTGPRGYESTNQARESTRSGAASGQWRPMIGTESAIRSGTGPALARIWPVTGCKQKH
jgi:hypothetical protein